MGVDGKRAPPLPAPTETDTGTELATEVSRVTDRTSQTLPEDGSPVTIATRKKHREKGSGSLSRESHPSQTSLLIEYFDGKDNRTDTRRPSVRVKVTPSSKSRSRSTNERVEITEMKGTRKPSYTKRINLSGKSDRVEVEGDNKSVSSYASQTEESNLSRNPVEIEVMPRSHSPLIPTGAGSAREVHQLGSDISSMPADSFLDGKSRSPERKRSRSLTRGEALAAGAAAGLAVAAAADTLHTPSRRRSRSLSRERIVAQKAVEKVRGDKSEHRRRKHSDQSRSRSVSNSEKHTEIVKSPRRRSSRNHGEESLLSAADMSQVSGSRVSGDQRSFRSGTSKSSINNPKLLETVEDAIRRLILPELTALKKEQKANVNREKFERERRGSLTSGSTGLSRDSREDVRMTRRVSNRSSAPDVSTSKPKVTIDGREVITGESRRDRREHHGSPRSAERSAAEEREEIRLRNKKSHDRKTGLGALAAGLGLGALAGTAVANRSKENIDETKERRRKRAKSRSRSDSLVESYEESERHEIVPPMPLMSDVNPSEVTRTSILSAETERPYSASEEHLRTPVREVSRGIASPSNRTPTRSPMSLHQSTPTERGQRSRSELSRESLRSHELQQEEEYELDEQGRKVPMRDSYEMEREEDYDDRNRDSTITESAAAGAVAGMLGAQALGHHNKEQAHIVNDHVLEEDENDYYHHTGEVPPPLKYVPYNAQKRGLSPIQSVSGYTEDEGLAYHQPRNSGLTRSTGSYSTIDQSPHHQISAKSIDSESPIRNNRHDFKEVRQGGLTESELTQDGEYWEEQHRENDRNREFDGQSFRSFDTQEYKRRTDYTDDSLDPPYSNERVSAGQSVRGLGANPGYVHTPDGVESAVASLVSASVLTAGSGGSGIDRKASYASYDEGSERYFTSRGGSPQKYDDQPRNLEYVNSEREVKNQRESPTKFSEFELDDQGRKISMPKYKTLTEEHDREVEPQRFQYEDRHEQIGAPLQKSFKDRAMDLPPRSPRHSLDRLIEDEEFDTAPQMRATGIPDLNNPMPEIGHGIGEDESEVGTNNSLIEGPIEGMSHGDRDHWSNRETPDQPQIDTTAATRAQTEDSRLKEAEAAVVEAAAAAGVAAAIASHERDASHEHEDEWKRTSEEAKRDTLITNPYEGTSPVTLLGGLQDRNLLQGMGYDGVNRGYATGSPGGLPKDEGYISSAPNARSPGAATPERRKVKGVGFMDDVGIGTSAGALDGEDPFYTPKHTRDLSGLSTGMESQLYESATGHGMDRIKSQDIVALMDHLTVRDAQRSARDTEILVTLVRAAAEMRNSFEDMKRLLADTEDVIITEVQRNTEKSVQKVINGPRPPPPSTSRSLRGSQPDTITDDIPNKRRNVFRRALKGLSMKSSNDLAKIETMLVQLLGEVEGLKVAQGLQSGGTQSDPYDDMQQEDLYEQDHGYEPEGTAGTTTASYASQSGHFSNPLSRGASASKGYDSRKFSENRISTVPEGDEEELDAEEQAILDNQFEHNEQLLTPTREATRGGSVPLGSPPQPYVAPISLSNENTPKTDKNKKHKSSGSGGWNPMKKISRWSETTASTVARGFRSSGTTRDSEQFEQPISRSGSDLGNYDDTHHGRHNEDKLHSGFSQEDIPTGYYEEGGPQMTSLLPPEDPKYKAHRNSLNLQHPQPRQGPTQRYQTQLETQAQDFGSPMSPKSVEWGSSTSVNRLPPNANRYSHGTNATEQMSPVSDAGYSHHLQGLAAAPARPPKEPLASSPPGPERPPKIRNKLTKPSPLSNEHLAADSTEDGKRISGVSSNGYESPSMVARVTTTSLGVPTRKPTGPRSMGPRSPSGNASGAEGSGNDVQTTRQRKRDTFGTIASNHSIESETF